MASELRGAICPLCLPALELQLGDTTPRLKNIHSAPVCVWVPHVCMPQSIHRGQRATGENQFSPPTTWNLGIKFGSPSLGARAFLFWAISLALAQLVLNLVYGDGAQVLLQSWKALHPWAMSPVHLFLSMPSLLGLWLSYEFKVVRGQLGTPEVQFCLWYTGEFFSSCVWPCWPLLPSSLHLVSPRFWQMFPSIVSSEGASEGTHPLLHFKISYGSDHSADKTSAVCVYFQI